MRTLTLAAMATLFATTADAASVAIVHAGKLLAVPGRPALENQTIVIRDGKIAAVLPGFVEGAAAGVAASDEAVVHDLKKKFVLPGLIDSHVHLLSENNPKQRLDRVEQSEADLALAGAGFARKTLMAGFTTVRDVGAGSSDAIFALRDGIARGDVVGPRIFASGATISVTGGHGDGTQGYRDDVAELLHSTGVCDGPQDCRRAVREQIRRGADHIKLTATGGVLSNTAVGLGQQFEDDELKAIVDSAHKMGRKVTAHAHGTGGVNAALRAGVDSIEHGSFLDDESISLFKKNGAYLVPTILAGATTAKWADDPNSFLLPPQRAKAKEVAGKIQEAARRAHAAGVKMAFGTDTGVSRHGDNAQEFPLLVAAGFTPMEAIRAATVAAADHLGKSDVLGTIAPGKYGDLIAVDGDPTIDVGELLDVRFVMKDGVGYDKRPI